MRAPQSAHELGQDGHRDLRGRPRAEVEPYRRMDARERVVVEARFLEAIQPFPVGALASQSTDVERGRSQRGHQSGVIHLGVMRQRDDGRPVVGLELLEGSRGPGPDPIHVREPKIP